MKFRIWKTSDDWNQPCDKSVLVKEFYDDTPYKHKVRIWEVEISTLEDLIELTRQSKYGSIIMFAVELVLMIFIIKKIFYKEGLTCANYLRLKFYRIGLDQKFKSLHYY